MNSSIETILFSEEEIKERVKQVGKEISEDYKGKKPVLVGILKGSVVFMVDWANKLPEKILSLLKIF